MARQIDSASRPLTTAVLAAVAFTVAAGLLRMALTPIVGYEVPFVTFFAAIMAASWFGGWRAGTVAVAASAFASHYYFVPPTHTVDLSRPAVQAGLVAFVFVGLTICAFAEALHRSRRQLATRNQELGDERASGERLRRSAQSQGEQLRLTLMSIGDAVIVTDGNGRIQTMNAVAESLTGWTATRALQRPIDEVVRLVDEETRRTLDGAVSRAMTEGRIVRHESSPLLVRPDGREVPIDDSAAPIRSEDGAIIGAVLVFRDVSTRRAAEAALRENESELADFFDNANVGLHWIGTDGRIMRANDEELRLFGYEHDEYVGHHLSEFHEDPEVVRDILDTLTSGRVLRDRAARIRCKDGTVKDVMINCTVRVAPDGSVHTRCFTLDVSDRVQAERTQALLAAVVESSEDAIVTKGLDGIVTSWNRGAERLFGYSAGEAIGRHITFIVPPDRHADETRILTLVGRGEVVPSFETERVRKDGAIVPVSLSVSPVRDPAGVVIGASKVARDISARIAMEAELREAGHRKDEFLATLAHELRNPLAPMRNALHLLGAIEPESARVGHVHGILSRQLEQMVRLIDDLLDLSRINRDKLELRRSDVPLDSIVRQAVETVRPLLDASRHLLRVELPSEPVMLHADPVRMAQVLTNLLSNASKFTDPGGQLSLEAERRDGMLQVRVGDNGIGVPVAHLERIFDMFAQGHVGMENSRGGLGIGLTLVRRFVELHGGTVRITSGGRGAGTTAIIDLPLGGPPSTTSAPRREASLAASIPGQTILVVDDNRDSADTLGMLLTLRGSAVRTVYDGASALRDFEASPSQIVLLDLGMPKLSGFDVCRALRELPGGREAIVVALTGWGQEQDRRRTQEAGFDAHLVKPVDLTTLLALLTAESSKRAPS